MVLDGDGPAGDGPVGDGPRGGRLSLAAYLGHLQCDAAAVDSCLADGDPAAPVRGCPGWDLTALVTHLGRTHRWTTAALASTDQPSYPSRPQGELRPWFAEGTRQLVAALRDADPDRPCWSLSPDPATSAFWVRRQAQETSVHRWDAQAAAGEPEPIDAALAADGVDEVARMFYPRQVALGRRERLPDALGLRCTDVDAYVVLGDGEPLAEVSGPAELLLLALWGRRPVDELTDSGALRLSGDTHLARSVLSEQQTP